jgi:hypothetical protein
MQDLKLLTATSLNERLCNSKLLSFIGFYEPTITASERSKTAHILVRAVGFVIII